MGNNEVISKKAQVYDYLKQMKIEYKKVKHTPVFTIDEAKALGEVIEGQQCKNLFLKNKKGREHYLVIMPENLEFNIKEFKEKFSLTNPSFASKERLYKYLGVSPGSVSVFGLLNDTNKEVKVFVSKAFNKKEAITFHPNSNDETLAISYNDFITFIGSLEYEIRFY